MKHEKDETMGVYIEPYRRKSMLVKYVRCGFHVAG